MFLYAVTKPEPMRPFKYKTIAIQAEKQNHTINVRQHEILVI